jgi:hypothetical protein
MSSLRGSHQKLLVWSTTTILGLVLWLFPSGTMTIGLNGRIDNYYRFGVFVWLEGYSTNTPFPYKNIGPLIFSVHASALVWTVLCSLLIAVIAYGIAKSLPWWVEPNRCRECGYNLTRNTTGKCPECGEVIGPNINKTSID